MEIKLLKADITQMKTQAIVNAANSSLMGGGGVDGAIHRAGGPKILEECKAIVDKQGQLPAGNAVITSAGKMPSQYVIHTVGPIWRGGNNSEEETLQKAYQSCLELAEKHQISSIAFPNISTGVYGFPKEKAATIAVEIVQKFKADSLEEVIFVCFDLENYEYYQKLLIG